MAEPLTAAEIAGIRVQLDVLGDGSTYAKPVVARPLATIGDALADLDRDTGGEAG